MSIRPNLRVLSLIAALALAGGAMSVAAPATQPTPYPLKTCLVSGEDLGDMGDPIVMTYEGRELKFCCASCVKKFKKDPATYLKQLDEAAKNPTTKPAAG